MKTISLLLVLIISGCSSKKYIEIEPEEKKIVETIEVQLIQTEPEEKSIEVVEPITITDEGLGFVLFDEPDTYTYTVKTWEYDRDCLWNIALRKMGSGRKYTIIYEANKNIIKDPDLIYPGQILTIPNG